MWKRIKAAIALKLVPIVRLYFRYTKFRLAKRYLWHAFYWRGRECAATTEFGVTMRLRTNDMVQGRIYYFGVWEPSITAFIKSRLSSQAESTFVDVGANVGYYSLLAAKCLTAGSVVAIEPFPEIYQQLLANIALNPYRNIRTVNCAATDSVTRVNMYYAGGENQGATTTIKNRFSSNPISVPGYPLGDLLSPEEIRATRLIKIDVEGAEHSVVNGISSLLDLFDKSVEVIVEISPSYLSEGDIGRIFALFNRFGFYAYALANPYSPDYYLHSRQIYLPAPLYGLPEAQTDVIFSRRSADSFFH